jgi:hypothetical protein
MPHVRDLFLFLLGPELFANRRKKKVKQLTLKKEANQENMPEWPWK